MNFEEALDFRDNYEKKVREAANFIKNKLEVVPEFGITLGSGLGDLANSIDISEEIDYKDIPNFSKTTVAGHEGKLIIGTLENVPIIGLKGRKHYYEVADEPLNAGILQVVFSVHVLAELGVKNYFVTNASGGLNPSFSVGDVMILTSHINQIPSPLMGREHNFKQLDGSPLWRFQPMNNAYDKELSKLFPEGLKKGVYLALTGPTYETEGEIIALRDGLKADAVGMSTCPEVIVARNRGMKVVGFSCITNKVEKDGTNATNHEEVVAILESKEVKDRLINSVKEFFKKVIISHKA